MQPTLPPEILHQIILSTKTINQAWTLTMILTPLLPKDTENNPYIYHSLIPNHPQLTTLICSLRNNQKILKWWFQNKKNIENRKAMNWAAQAGHTTILNMWNEYDKKHKLKPIYTEYAMNAASRENHQHVLEWFKNTYTIQELKYNEDAINHASGNGHVRILQWWFESGLEMRYTEHAMDQASTMGHIETLKWWKNSTLTKEYTKRSMDHATMNGHVKVLQFWFDWLGSDVQYSSVGIHYAIQNQLISVLQWWAESKLPIRVPESKGLHHHNILVREQCKALNYVPINQSKIK